MSSDETDRGPARPVDPASPPEPAGARAADRAGDAAKADRVGGQLVLYTLLRLALVAGLTAVLTLFMPLIIALMFAIIIQLPLAWLLFGAQRRRVNAGLAQASAHRRSERERLRSALAGEDPGETEPDPRTS